MKRYQKNSDRVKFPLSSDPCKAFRITIHSQKQIFALSLTLNGIVRLAVPQNLLLMKPLHISLLTSILLIKEYVLFFLFVTIQIENIAGKYSFFSFVSVLF